jgi:hypothetical protein
MPGPDQAALAAFLSKILNTPSIKKMGEATKLAKDLGLDEKLVDLLIPVLCRFVIAHQSKGKLKEAADFVAHVVASAADFAPDLVDVLEKA